MTLVEHEDLSAGSALPEGVIGYGRSGRRRYSPEFRHRIAQECRESSESLASIALRYGINANLVRKWMDKYAPPDDGARMLPVSLSTLPRPSMPANCDGSVVIELGGATITVTGNANYDVLNAVINALR